MKRFVSMKMFEFEIQTPVKRSEFETMTPTKSFKTPRRFESMKRFEALTPVKGFGTMTRPKILDLFPQTAKSPPTLTPPS